MTRARSVQLQRPQAAIAAAMALACGLLIQSGPMDRLIAAGERIGDAVASSSPSTTAPDTPAPSPTAFHRSADGSLRVVNRAAGLRATYDGQGLAVRPRTGGDTVHLTATTLGRAGVATTLPAVPPIATDETVIARRGVANEWVQSRATGLEQGWTIPARQPGSGPLTLTLGIRGAAVQRASRTALSLVPPHGSVISYAGLVVRDARGHRLPAYFTTGRRGTAIRIDDAHAHYPVVVDPDLTAVQVIGSPPTANGNQLGSDVDVSGRWMAVKEPGARLDSGATRLGRIDVYHDADGTGAWQLVSQLGDFQNSAAAVTNTGVAITTEAAGVTVFAIMSTGAIWSWTFAGDPDTVAPNASPVQQPPLTGVSPAGAFILSPTSIDAGIDTLDGTGLLVAGYPNAGDQGVRTLNPDGSVGSPSEQIGTAEVFRRHGPFGSPWAFEARIDPPGGITQPPANRDILQLFGTSVSINPVGAIAIGAPGDDGVQTHTGGTIANPAPFGTTTNEGSVYTFNFQGASWVQEGRLTSSPTVAGAKLGSSVAVAPDDTIVAGAPLENSSTGAAYLFTVTAGPGTYVWNQVQRVIPDDPTTPANEAVASSGMGTRVAIDTTGRRFSMAAPNQAIATGKNGAVYVYTRANSGPATTGTFTARLVPATASDQHGGLAQGFGTALAASDNDVVVGASGFGSALETLVGRVVAFHRTGTSYAVSRELQPLGSNVDGDAFGTAVAQDGDELAVSLPGSSRGSGFGQGAVAIYHRDTTGAWVFEQMLFPYSNIKSTGNTWGSAVALHVTRDAQGHDIGLTVAVGDQLDSFFDPDGNGPTAGSTITNAGSVALFGRDGPPGTAYQNGYKIWADGRESTSPLSNLSGVQAGAGFGFSVAFTADGTLLVGAPGADGDSGAVYRFDKATPTTSVQNYFAQQKVAAPSGSTGFGEAVAADGTNVLVAPSDGSGLARFTDGGPTANLVSAGGFPMDMSDGAVNEPIALTLVGNRYAVSGDAPGDDTSVYRVRMYRIVGNVAVREADVRPTSFGGVGLGLSLDHGGSVPTLVVGSPDVSGDGGDATVYVAKVRSDGSAQWSKSGNLTIPAADTPAMQFGYSVTNWPTNGGAVVGAPQADVQGVASGAVFTYDTSGVVPPPGPQAFVDVTLPTTVPVGASQLKTAGLPPSLLTQHSTTDGSIAAAPLGSIDLSQAPQGSSLSASPMSAIPMSAIPMSAIPMSAIPLSSIPLTNVPGGWGALLAGTAFAGVPLQNVTLSEVYSLPSVQALPLGALTLAGSPLASIPMSAIALGAMPLAGLPLDPASSASAIAQWCAAITAAHGDPAALGIDCANPDASHNTGATVLSVGMKGAPMSAIPMSAIPMSAISLAGTPMSAIPMSAISLAGTPMSAIPMSAIDISGTPMSAIPMSAIPMSAIPMSAIPMSAIPMSAIPMSAIPMSAISLGGTPMSAIPMSAIDIASTPMSAIPMSAIPMSAIPMSAIPMSAIPMSAIPMSAIPMSAITIGGTPMSAIPMSAIDVLGSPMSAIKLADLSGAQRDALVDCALVDCAAATLGDAVRGQAVKTSATLGDLQGHLGGARYSDLIGAGGITVDQLRAALGSRTLADVTDFGNLTLGDLPQVWPYLKLGDARTQLGGVRLSDIARHLRDFTASQVQEALANANLHLSDLSGWDDVTLGQADTLLQYLKLGDLTPALKGIRLADLVGAIAKPGGGTYSAEELRAALNQAMPNATLGDLTDLDNLTLGELGAYGDTTLGQLFGAITSGAASKITLGDLLLAMLNPKQYPWSSLDLSQVEAQALDNTPTGSPVTIAYRSDAPDGLPRTVRVTVELPPGARLDRSTIAGDASADELGPTISGSTATWTFTNVPAGAPQSLTFAMDAPLTIGPKSVRATAFLVDDDATDSDTASTTVTEAFEPNDTVATATPLPDDTIMLSHVSHAGDLDVYKFDVTDPGTRVSLSLSNLDADLDMVLYAPRDGSIVATGGRTLTPVNDQGGTGLPAASQDGTTTPQPSAGNDIPDPAGLGDHAVIQASFNRGRTDEQIDTGVLTKTGTYYLAVSGYNAASDTQPYALRLKRFVSHDQPACPSRNVPAGTLGTELPATLPSGTNTVFVVNRSRMAGLYGEDKAAALMDQLHAFTTWLNSHNLGQKASVLTVDADPAVRDAYSRWDASPCLPSGANGVVSEIARILNGYRTNGANLKNVVLVGDDDAVPFARVPDRTTVANETGYASTFSDAGNALYATFATSSVQTDNVYVDRSPYAFGDRTLYIPDASIGRLVETPNEIGNQLTDFQNANGKLAVGTGLVTGYDFLSDGARNVSAQVDRTYGSVDTHLISDTWTRQDLENAIASIKPNLLSINAHFDHFRSLPGAGNTTHDETDLFTAAAVRGALNGDLAGSVVFSMGCHSGLSASDLLLGGTDSRALDFAQAVSSQGGVFVGNTGFGYGDTDTVALSEQLMGDFAQRLDGSMTVGDALLYAKNAYFSGLAQQTPYDEKVLEETTFYGLPFYTLDVPNPPAPPAPVSPILVPDDATSLSATTTHIQPTYADRTASDGTTYTAAVDPVTGQDDLTTVQGRPVEPRADQEYALPTGTAAHDALVLGLTSVDHPGTDPYVFQPIVDSSGERTSVGVDTAFPTRAVQVNDGLSPAGPTFHVAATTGYFRTTAPDGKGLQRTYQSMDVETFLAPKANTDWTAPTFSQVTGQVANGLLTISAHVMDDRGDASRVKRVYLLVLQDPPAGVATTWRSLDLTRTSTTDEWTGSIPTTGRNLEFVLQAVDAAGNVAVTTDKADNFADGAVVGGTTDPGSTGGTGGGTIAPLNVSLSGPQGNAGWYTGPVTVTVTGGTRIVYEVVGEKDPAGYQQPFQVSGTGLHTVRVTSGDGQNQTVTIPIDSVGPTVRLDSPAVGQLMPAAPGSLILFSCPDAGSGSSSCTATLDGSPVTSGSTVPLPPGQHTVVVTTGPDNAGNAPSQRTLTRTFTVVPAPATVGTIGVTKPKDGATTTLTVPFTGYTVLTYSGTVAWGDGATTNCAMAGSGCTVTRNGSGGGTLTATHVYPTSYVDTTATVSIVDNLGQSASGTVLVNRKTTMTATAALLQIKAGTSTVTLKSGAISATLKNGSGAALSGQTITFSLPDGTTICTATTNASGTAACPTTITFTVAMVLAGRYNATFAGKDTYHGSTASASLIG
ncbi:MAG TPA: C25 family cysteine peptidase [Nocardioides sp.]|nr:C25 family cysteine peptidase [Nocardioides sp.]